MDLIDVKISEIKNLGLIYVYSTDRVFTDEESRFLGLKISYNNGTDYMQLDFTDPHFPAYVKKVVSRYNQEKDNRNIILLGNLSERLMNDDEIRRIAEERQEFNSVGLTLFSTKKEKLKSYEPYLKEILKQIFEQLKRYKAVTIDKIDGYNNKFIVKYSIGPVSSQLPMIISFIDDNTVNFRIGSINGEAADISGVIHNDLNQVVAEWKSEKEKASGIIAYDVANDFVEKKVTIRGEDIFHRTEGDTIVETDEELIRFYLNLFGISWDKDFLKTDDYNFIFGFSDDKIKKEEDILIENHGMQLFITDDEVVLKYIIRNNLNKYDNSLLVSLDQELFEINVKKIYIDGDIHLLVEKTSSNSYGKKYDYVVYKTGDIDFKKPFVIQEEAKIDGEIKSIYDVEVKALELMGGRK